jgi:hypothetical protein
LIEGAVGVLGGHIVTDGYVRGGGTDQPGGWLGGTIKVDWPILTNLGLDPFERMNLPNGANDSLAFYNWFAFEFWRFQFVQKEVPEVAQSAIEYPPMQKDASFNLEAVKAQIEKAIAAHATDVRAGIHVDAIRAFDKATQLLSETAGGLEVSGVDFPRERR